ncbi:hypothetical protein JTB14_005170 [Gonioctena quinquepunctata]|nr:hypothetical protein JTB14_005170 [Gonioctena quinquepunctata]
MRIYLPKQESHKVSGTSIDIGVECSAPVNKPPYRVPFQQQPVVRHHIEKMLQEDIVRPSASPYGALVVLVEKKGTIGIYSGFCTDCTPAHYADQEKSRFHLVNCCPEAFKKLMATLIQESILKYPDFSLATDAYGYAIEIVLGRNYE